MDAYMPFIWLAVIVLSVVVEASTFTLVSVWFIPAALVSMILAFCSVDLWIQLVAFVAIALLLIIFMKPIFKNVFGVKPIATNADAVIGERAVVIEPIDNLAGKGQVKVKGQIWTARAHDKDATYEKDDVVNVIAIEGVKLICKK